jgi:hypothetical protein
MLLQERSILKTLFDGPTKRKLFADQSREHIFTRLSDRCRKHCRTGLIFTCQVLHISMSEIFHIKNQWDKFNVQDHVP